MFDLERHLLHKTNFMLHQLSLDVPFLQLLLWIIGPLFLISLIRWFRLSSANRRMRKEGPKLEKQIISQQIELTGIRHETASWRAKMQRQFDAVRSELSAKHQQAEQGNQFAQKKLDAAQQQTLDAALAKINDLEAKLAARTAAPAPEAIASLPKPGGLAKPPQPSLPSLPSMEMLRIQSLESELAAAKAELCFSRRQNAALQRALQLARRRPPATKKTAGRGVARST